MKPADWNKVYRLAREAKEMGLLKPELQKMSEEEFFLYFAEGAKAAGQILRKPGEEPVK